MRGKAVAVVAGLALCVLIGMALSSFARAPQTSGGDEKAVHRWEYRTVYLPPGGAQDRPEAVTARIDRELKRLGADGWEFAFTAQQNLYFVFKRPKK
jgi:hypothetical protein